MKWKALITAEILLLTLVWSLLHNFHFSILIQTTFSSLVIQGESGSFRILVPTALISNSQSDINISAAKYESPWSANAPFVDQPSLLRTIIGSSPSVSHDKNSLPTMIIIVPIWVIAAIILVLTISGIQRQLGAPLEALRQGSGDNS